MFSPETSASPVRLLDVADGKTAYSLPATAPAVASRSNVPAPAESVVGSLFREEASAAARREALIRCELSTRVFDHGNPPPKPIPVLQLGGKTISTAGNLTLIQAPVKAGKTAVVTAILAAIFNGNRQGPDTLGFSSENPRGLAVIYVDTELSRHDFHTGIVNAMARGRIDSPPAWFEAYCLTDMTVAERRTALDVISRDAKGKHGGIHAVLIDGVADLCTDPNDQAESNTLVSSLHSAAISCDCPFVLVIHENHGSESGKTRGHLGSQLARKAETPLRLNKDETTGITTVWADRARHCHIPRGEGLCFQWSEAARMHVSCGTAREIRADAKRAKFENEAKRAFGDDARLAYTDLRDRIMEVSGIAKKTAEARVTSYAAEGLIVKGDDGKHTLTPGLPLTLKLPSKDPSRV